MSYAHKRHIMHTPQVHVKFVEAAAANALVYSQVIARKNFRTALVFLQLTADVAGAGNNLPTKFEVYGVEDAADAANTRVKVLEKDLTGVTGWSGKMFLELDETHLAVMLGSQPDGSPKSLDHIQVAVAGPENVEYDVVVVLQNPYTSHPDLILEKNV